MRADKAPMSAKSALKASTAHKMWLTTLELLCQLNASMDTAHLSPGSHFCAQTEPMPIQPPPDWPLSLTAMSVHRATSAKMALSEVIPLTPLANLTPNAMLATSATMALLQLTMETRSAQEVTIAQRELACQSGVKLEPTVEC